MNQRGVSPVLGMVLLVGLTAVVAVGMLAVGTSLTDSTVGAAENQQIESSMQEMADIGDRVGNGATDDAHFSMPNSPDGTAAVDPDAGHLVITHERDGGATDELYNDSLGAYTYEHDGVTFAYQGGGIWRLDDSGDVPQIVKAPSFEYRNSSTPTLNFPIQRVTGSYVDSTGGMGELAVESQRRVFPDSQDHQNPLIGGSVYVDITSEFCEGWERYTDARTDGNVAESCNETGETLIGELRVELGVPTLSEVNAAAIATDQISPDHGGSGQIDGPVMVEGGEENIGDQLDHGDVTDEIPPLREVKLQQKMDECDGDFDDAPEHSINASGTHCINDIGVQDEVTVEPDDGPISIVIEGEIDSSGNKGYITVENTTGETENHEVNIYAGDEITYTTSEPLGNPHDPGQTSIYTNSHVEIIDSTTNVYGLVYAPVDVSEGNATVEVRGDATVTGSIISTTIHVQGDGSTIRWDESVDGVEAEAVEVDTTIHYLHLSETTLRVQG